MTVDSMECRWCTVSTCGESGVVPESVKPGETSCAEGSEKYKELDNEEKNELQQRKRDTESGLEGYQGKSSYSKVLPSDDSGSRITSFPRFLSLFLPKLLDSWCPEHRI